MSEFVVCQNCGKRFFAENLDCPYCKDQQDLQDLIDEVQRTPTLVRGSGVAILIAAFMVLLAVAAVLEFAVAALTPVTGTRVVLAVQATFTFLVVAGLMQRRRWSRTAAVWLILSNAVVGAFLWGRVFLSLLLFLVPFLSRPVRHYLSR